MNAVASGSSSTNNNGNPIGSGSPRRVFSRSHSHRPTSTSTSTFGGSPGSQLERSSLTKSKAKANNANATFLTECSFGVAHDRLVQVITDVQPFEPHWEELGSIDLSNAKLESVARLKEFLPRLDALSL